jgi:hypothetical protein
MKNTLSILAVAAFTMVTSLAVLVPRSADAEDGEETKTAETLVKITPLISMPKLEEGDCTVTLRMDKESYAEGDKPVLTVEFTNESKEAVEKTVTVSMVSRSVFEGGRMPAIAQVVWTKEAKVSLAAGETKSVTLETDIAVNANNAFSFQMANGSVAVEKDAAISRVIR